MNLFENLRTLHESYVKTVDDVFEDITDTIQERIGCDIDDTYYDTDNYPEEFKARFVIYNISYSDCEIVEEILNDKLSNYNDVDIDIYDDDRYYTTYIDVAYVIQIRAHDNCDDF